jgi:fumarate reductase flavoprotein subunit
MEGDMQKMNTDIAIIAGGTAGLAAAAAAAESGAGVIVLEKADKTGGCGNMANGLFAVESRHQREMQLALTREEIYQHHMNYVHWKADGRLVRAYIDKSSETIDWLENLGVEFASVESHGAGNYYTWHVCKSSAPMGACAGMMTTRVIATTSRRSSVIVVLGRTRIPFIVI